MTRPRWIGSFLLAMAVTIASPTLAMAAVKDDVSDPLDWDCAWSLYRWILLAGVAVLAWLICFHVWFPSRISSPSASSKWPMDIFGTSAALFVLLVVFGFIVIFGLVSDELTRRPVRILPGQPNSFVNRNFLWAVIAVGGVVLAAITRTFVFRHRGS